MAGDSIPPEFRTYIETSYTFIPKNDEERIADNLIDLAAAGMDTKQPLKVVFEQVAKFIFRQFGFSEVAIGLKDRKDPVWKYEVALGFSKDTELRILKVRYNKDDMYSQETFPNLKLGKLSELNVAEGLPPSEADMYDRQKMLNPKRTSSADFMLGDSIDIWMLDDKKEIIGWIEVSSPKDRKLPSRTTTRWLELLGSLCAQIVMSRWAEDEMRSKKAAVP